MNAARVIRFILYIVLILAAFLIGSLFIGVVEALFGNVGLLLISIGVVLAAAWHWSKPPPPPSNFPHPVGPS